MKISLHDHNGHIFQEGDIPDTKEYKRHCKLENGIFVVDVTDAEVKPGPNGTNEYNLYKKDKEGNIKLHEIVIGKEI